MKNFLFKNKFLTTAFFKKTKLSLFLLCFVIPGLSHATQKREGLFLKIKNSIHRMIHGQSVEIHQDLNNNSITQQVNLNSQSFNNDTSSIKTTNLKATNQKPKKQPTLHNQQTNKETTNPKPTLHNQQTNKEATNPDLKKQNYPFFWQIERDGKKSYILGTNHKGVNFNELLFHRDIKDYLRSADFLLSEIPKYSQLELEFSTTETTKIMTKGLNYLSSFQIPHYYNQFSSLNQQEIDFLINLWREIYFKKTGNYPSYTESKNKLISFTPPELTKFIESSVKAKTIQEIIKTKDIRFILWYFIIDIKNKILENYNSKKTLDYQIEDYFLKHKKKPSDSSNIKFSSSLDNVRLEMLINRYTEDTIVDVKEMIKHYPNNQFSKEEIKEFMNNKLLLRKKIHKLFLSGELNYENIEREFENKTGVTNLKTINNIIKWEYFSLDFRNQLWVPKIIEAFEQHNSIFILAGLAHFIKQERNPLNIPELEEYARQNKNIPPNILDMLKNEGFKVTRFGEGDFTPANSCQTAFLK